MTLQKVPCIDSFHGCGFTSGGQESVSVFYSAAVCKIQGSKRYIKSCFSQGERSAVQLPFDRAFALWKLDA